MPWNLTSEMQNVIPEPCYTSLLTARQRLQQLPPGGRKDHLARRSLLGALRNCPANAVVLDEVGEGLRLLGEPAAALAVFRCGARRGLWRHPLQRVTEKETQMQLHSVAVLEDDAMQDFPELQRVHHLVEKHHGRIRMEFLRALQNPRVWRVAASLLPCNHDKLCWENGSYLMEEWLVVGILDLGNISISCRRQMESLPVLMVCIHIHVVYWRWLKLWV